MSFWLDTMGGLRESRQRGLQRSVGGKGASRALAQPALLLRARAHPEALACDPACTRLTRLVFLPAFQTFGDGGQGFDVLRINAKVGN